jgi:hypothetical protein
MTIELTLTNAITITALFAMSLWALVKLLLLQQERRAAEREERWANRVNETATHIARLGEDARALRERLVSVESASRQLPSHTDIGKVYERVNAQSEQLGQMAGELGAMRRSLEMLQSFLLNGGRKS